jgi:nucleoside-diphosphate-sugar epimerase
MDDYDKILVESAVMSDPALPCAVIRLPAVYGPRDGQHRLRPWLKRIDDGRPAILMEEADAAWRWTYGYVDDMAHAITLAALDSRSAGNIYNVGEVDPPTTAERARLVSDMVGWQGRIAIVPTGALPEPLRLGVVAGNDFISSSARIRADLGYTEQTPLTESYDRAIAWERANPPASDNPAEYDYAEEDRILADLG